MNTSFDFLVVSAFHTIQPLSELVGLQSLQFSVIALFLWGKATLVVPAFLILCDQTIIVVVVQIDVVDVKRRCMLHIMKQVLCWHSNSSTNCILLVAAGSGASAPSLPSATVLPPSGGA